MIALEAMPGWSAGAAPAGLSQKRASSKQLGSTKDASTGSVKLVLDEKSSKKMPATTEQRASQLAELKGSLPAAQQALLGSGPYFFGEVNLMRLLDAKSGNVRKAREQFLSNALWRKQMCIDTMTIAHTVDKSLTGTFICPGVYDSVGRPVIFMMAREVTPGPNSTLHLTRCLL